MPADPAPSQVVERLRMALAEMGFSKQSCDVKVYVRAGETIPCISWPIAVPEEVGQAASWRAYAVIGLERLACWDCWKDAPRDVEITDCTHPIDITAAPLPARPGDPQGAEGDELR